MKVAKMSFNRALLHLGNDARMTVNGVEMETMVDARPSVRDGGENSRRDWSIRAEGSMLRLESGIPWHAPESFPDLFSFRQAMKMSKYPLLLLAVVQRWLWLTVTGRIGYDAECGPRSDLTVVKINIKNH